MEASGFVMSKSQRGEVGVTTSESVAIQGVLIMRDGCYHVKWVQLGIDKAMLASEQESTYSSLI